MGIYANEVHGHKPVESTALVAVDHTDLTIILDRLGSMASVQEDMEGGFNRFRDEQKKVPGEMLVTLYQFDTVYENIPQSIRIANVPDLDLVPHGFTALLDSVYKGIVDAAERVDNTLPKSKAIVIIITDGYENSSREVGLTQVRELVQQKEKDGWQFVYLGANQDAFAEATNIGIKASSAMNYAPDKASINVAFSNVSAATTRSRSGSIGNTGGFFDDDERDARK